MRFDHHLHTARHSPDSSIDPLELIAKARQIGLDGIVITEHDYQWEPDELAELAALATPLCVFSGAEISALEGHFLVYGLPTLDDVPPGIDVADLVRVVRQHNAAIVGAHPFRWDQPFDEIIATHGPVFDALEFVSNNVSPETRQKTERSCANIRSAPRAPATPTRLPRSAATIPRSPARSTRWPTSSRRSATEPSAHATSRASASPADRWVTWRSNRAPDRPDAERRLLSLWRKDALLNELPTQCDAVIKIDLQHGNRCPASCKSHQYRAIPPEMAQPFLTAGITKWNDSARIVINPRDVRSLVPVACEAA